MGDSHDHGVKVNAGNKSRLLTTLVLVSAYTIAEIIGGLCSHSLALLADAAHMFSDTAALGLSLFAVWVAQRPPTPQHSYGYHRTEILAVLANGATLIAVSIYIFTEAYQRLGKPPEVQGGLVAAIALGGFLVNLAAAWVLNSGKADNLNVRGAWLHVITDSLGNLGTVVAGALIWAYGWYMADPIISVLIGVLVLYSTWGLLRESVGVLMEWAPAGIDVAAIERALRDAPGVLMVCDLHIWAISSGKVALSARVVEAGGLPPWKLLTDLHCLLHEQFDLDHITLQVEPEGFDTSRQCRLESHAEYEHNIDHEHPGGMQEEGHAP